MERTAFVAAIVAGIIFANVCCTLNPDRPVTNPQPQEYSVLSHKSSYGAYLAGRVAHLRHRLNTAADYYMLAEENAPENLMLPSQLYVMLTSQGRVDEAVKYADKALQNKDGSLMIYSVKAAYEIKQQNYQKAMENMVHDTNPFAQTLLNPLVNAWCYAGLGQYEEALKSLKN